MPRPGIYTRAGKFLSQVGKNTATPSAKIRVCAEDFNESQTKKKAKENQKTKKRKRKAYIRSVKKENEKGEQLKICGVQYKKKVQYRCSINCGLASCDTKVCNISI